MASQHSNDLANPAPVRFTLERLSSAFARLTGATSTGGDDAGARPQLAVEPDDASLLEPGSPPVTPRMIVEAMLFVGAADGRALTSRDMAASVRDVTPQEVDAIVNQLNGAYQRDAAAYEIVGDASGYRLQLRAEHAWLRERFSGRTRAAQLTLAALETLAIVAYKQPVTSEEISQLRGTRSHAILAQLVRRQLAYVVRPEAGSRTVRYRTTERFNRLFGVSSPSDLPQAEDLDDS